MSLPFLSSLSHRPISVGRGIFGRKSTSVQSVEALLARIRQRLYPETLPVLASAWLRTLCSAGHNRAWWSELDTAVKQALRDEPLETFARDVVQSIQNWIEANVLRASEIPAGRHIEPPFRSLPVERLVPYVTRLLNEWLPAEVAHLLTTEADLDQPQAGGIPVLAPARALERVLVRERLSPETLEALISPGLLSPELVYPADVEILQDLVLAHLGRVWPPAASIMPATLLGVVADTAIPLDYRDSIAHASLVECGEREELHVPLEDADAVRILRADSRRIGSLLVTMDGRVWHASRLHAGEGAMLVYTPGGRLRIDFSADHAKLTVRWPESPLDWSGPVPLRGPFRLFGREWRMASWDLDGDGTLLHLTFSRYLPISGTPQPDASPRLLPASVDMAWAEVERAIGEASLRNSWDPVEQMRRTDLIPLTRALYALVTSVQSGWIPNRKQIETHLGAVRYHMAATTPVYGRAPWHILPVSVQKALQRMRLNPASVETLIVTFNDLPSAFLQMAPTGRPNQPAHPPQAA